MMKKWKTITLQLEGDVRIVVTQQENSCETAACSMQQPPQPEQPQGADIRLNLKKITKIDFIRVVYTLCKLGAFVNSLGEELKPLKVFQAFGRLLDIDLSGYQNDLNNSLQQGKTEEKHLSIFKKMLKVMKDKYLCS
jgi:hypothetical protein